MNGRLILSVTIALLLFYFSISFSAEITFTGKVVGVIDGDSLRIMHKGRAEQVRLSGIDCPEKGQAFGQRAKQATSDLSFGRQVIVHSTSKDRFKRTLATVDLLDGRNLNHELVRNGWCWWYRDYAPNDTELEALETEARQARRGLWNDPAPIPPWIYRKARQKKKSDLSDLAPVR
ncbi:MAG: thermonuclease family protein [Nitrospira sp.]|nr:thermonuclease family protein [Nitrospira sp.]MDH4242705.1 thermonuclease family protein [Nitrospira sp.]MDH4355026.1 thermonuclease family protein [Nitrospira sp.]MDH5316988.1 thermonuclease family protein [Nitrospira sp.]